MSDDDVSLRIAVAWRDLRRTRPQPLSVPIPLGQLDTMDVLAHLGPCTMAELSEALSIDASTATRAVARLVQVGLVRRDRSDEDGRSVVVALTPEGLALERKLARERMRILGRVLSAIPVEYHATIAQSMEQLIEATRETRWSE